MPEHFEGKLDTQNWKHLQDTKCEFFPCHKLDDPSKFNCRFCYCPAFLIDNCPGIEGGYAVILENGYKDCSACTINHNVDTFNVILDAVDNEVRRA